MRQSERGCFSFGGTSRRKRHSILLFTRTSNKDGMALASDCVPTKWKSTTCAKARSSETSSTLAIVLVCRHIARRRGYIRSNQSYLIARSTSRIKLHPVVRSLARSLARHPLPAANGAAFDFFENFRRDVASDGPRNRPIAQVSRIFQSERRASRRVPQLRRDWSVSKRS